MNEKEIEQLIKQLKTQFKQRNKHSSEEEIEHCILDLFFQMYCENKMDRADLTTLTEFMGYEVDNEILDQIEKEKEQQ